VTPDPPRLSDRGPDERPDRLLLDEVSEQLDRAFRLLRGDTDQAADLAFAEIGVDSAAEARLVGQLAERTPLAHPHRFLDAHRLTMRALEVLDRDGHRHPRLPRLGLIGPAVQLGVERVARYVVSSFVADAVRALSRLYARRESQTLPTSPERAMLARTRAQADRLTLGYRGGSSPLAGLLAGGAAVPVLVSLGRRFGNLGIHGWEIAGVLVVLAVLFAALSWIVIQGAGLAHRRVAVVAGPALRALYETIGDAGEPPQDDGRTIAAVGIGLTAVAWFVLPLVVVAVLALVR
jgi:hypothetical protein